jgi:thiol-disulfide isomerase/thioredoxin
VTGLDRTLLALLACVIIAAGTTSGQSGRVKEQPGTKEEGTLSPGDSRPAQALFEEVNHYVDKKYEEFNQKKLPYDAKLEATTREEQKSLAAKYARMLQGRASLAGDDLYYLGMLQHLAGNSEAALVAMRLFLGRNPDGEKAQFARAVVVVHALKKSLVSEAEAAAADYARNQPQNLSERFGMESLIADAFYKAADFEHTAKHAEAMLNLARQALSDKSYSASKRDQMLLKAATLLAEAIETFDEVRSIAIARPSANLYKLATGLLLGIDPAADLQRVFENLAGEPRPLPEIIGSQWIDQQATTLANLRGHVVLLDFWAPWCGPCRYAFPKLQKWYASYKDKGLVILGVTNYYGQVEGHKATQEQELAYLQEFKKKNHLAYGFVVADSSVNDVNYGVFSIPMSFLIDRRGNLRFIALGANDEQTTVLGKVLKRLLDEPAETKAGTETGASPRPVPKTLPDR